MFNPLLLLALAGGIVAGLTAGWFLFSKGKKISMALQAQINEQKRELSAFESQIREAQGQIRSAETEAKATAKEIISEAKHATRSEEHTSELQSQR